MKKAVIAVAAVLVFIFTLTQKSEAATARDGYTLSRLISNNTDYYSSPIELTNNITSDDNFASLTLVANKKITSVPGSSFSLTFDARQSAILSLNKKKLMFQRLSMLTFTNATDSAIQNRSSLITFDSLAVKFLDNNAYESGGVGGSGGAISNLVSTVSFVNSTVNFSGNSAYWNGGAIFNSSSTVSFVNSTVNFSANTAGDYGGAIYNRGTVSFVNSIVSFTGNSAYGKEGRGGAIVNYASSTIVFKGRSRVIFDGNLADGGADIFNNGTIEISERSEMILRSGINGNPSEGGVINIKSGTLTISADEIFIRVLNVWAGGKFSLVDRQAIFVTVYTTKIAQIDNLIVAGILEIGIDLNTDDINDLISSADSITFQKGSSLKIVPFNKWSSPKTYLVFEGDLRGFENLDYDRSRFVLRYDKKTKTLSLRVIKDPTR